MKNKVNEKWIHIAKKRMNWSGQVFAWFYSTTFFKQYEGGSQCSRVEYSTIQCRTTQYTTHYSSFNTFFKSYAEMHGHTQSYLPCTITVGKCLILSICSFSIKKPSLGNQPEKDEQKLERKNKMIWESVAEKCQ